MKTGKSISLKRSVNLLLNGANKHIAIHKAIVLCSAFAASMLCACNQHPAAAAVGNDGVHRDASAGRGAGSAYEIVLETRPEKPVEYLGRQRAFYDLCVAAAQAQNLPVKPFVTPPKDFVTMRQTYLSDGTRFLEKTENFDFDAESMLPEEGCATKLAPSVSTKIWSGGKLQTQEIDRDGKSVAAPPIDFPVTDAPRTNRIEPYTMRQTIQGVAARCLPPDSPVIQNGVMLASCIADLPGDTTLFSVAGKPILIHDRIQSNESDPRFASLLVTMPKSVMVGKEVPRSQFTLR